jgi:hypothetical protein
MYCKVCSGVKMLSVRSRKWMSSIQSMNPIDKEEVHIPHLTVLYDDFTRMLLLLLCCKIPPVPRMLERANPLLLEVGCAVFF